MPLLILLLMISKVSLANFSSFCFSADKWMNEQMNNDEKSLWWMNDEGMMNEWRMKDK